MVTTRLCGVAAVLALGAGFLCVARSEEKKETPPPKIQVAVLLDTSNSMDGLINQARTQLWKAVSEFTTIRLAGRVPTLEVALYEYGNDGLPAAEGFIRMVVPFTTDLDKVSEAMFALRTNGGSEFCGRVIDNATRNLTWSESNKDVKCIFIAGNEPFMQGDVDYRKSCKAAAAKGITISTIFCGPNEEGIRTNWKDGATLADGQYMSIDHNQAVVAIPAPQDKEIVELGAKLNSTYLAYGDAKNKDAAKRQVAQDANAAGASPSVAAARASVKGSSAYRNADWDLVDALADGKVKLDAVEEERLPEALKELGPAERKAHVEKLTAERKQIQAKITELNDARKKYLAGEEQKLQAAAKASGKPMAGAPAFEKAIVEGVKAEAAKK